jgi:hypothetical protein
METGADTFAVAFLRGIAEEADYFIQETGVFGVQVGDLDADGFSGFVDGEFGDGFHVVRFSGFQVGEAFGGQGCGADGVQEIAKFGDVFLAEFIGHGGGHDVPGVNGLARAERLGSAPNKVAFIAASHWLVESVLS